MEDRHNKRLPATIDVMVCDKQQLPAIHFKTDNAGIGGIFIKTASEMYKIGTLLDVLFEIEWRDRYKTPWRYRLPARVVHSSKEGIGLTFLEASIETTLAWQQILYRNSQFPHVTTLG